MLNQGNDTVRSWVSSQVTGTGDINSQIKEFLESETELTGTLDDLWMQWAITKGINTGTIQDRVNAVFKILGYNPSGKLTPGELSAVMGTRLFMSYDGSIEPDIGIAAPTFTRGTTATVEDHEGVQREVLSGEARFQGQRRVYNLSASTDTPSTQGVTVVSGRVYQISIGADSASGATAILTGAATGTLTGDATNGQSFDTAKTAVTTTLTITISGSIKNLQVEDVTGASNQAPASYVSKGTLSAPYHGTGVDGSKVFLTDNGNSVSSGVVTEATGSPITGEIGYFSEIARTNKCTNYNANPASGAFAPTSAATFNTNMTNLVASGGDGSTLWGVVDDATELAAAGLDALCTDNLVYKIDNSAGTGSAVVEFLGQTGNTNKHSFSIRVRAGTGTANLIFGGGVGLVSTTSSTYIRLKSENVTPIDSVRTIKVYCGTGDVIYFILNQLEEGAFSTSEIITEGAAVTRNKDDLDYPSTNIPVSIEITTDFTPTAAGQGTIYICGSYVGASNYTAILHDGTNFIARKRISAVNYDATKTQAYVADTTYAIKATFSSTGGVDIEIDSVAGTGDANTTDIQLGSTMVIGALNAASHQTGGIKNFTITSVE